MKKINLIFKVLFIILYFPILFSLKEKTFVNNNFNIFLITGIIIIFIFIKEIIKNIDYIIHNVENPEKQKINSVILYVLIFSIFYLPQKIVEPLLNVNALIMIGYTFYITIFIFYAGFIYKLVVEYNKFGNKIFKSSQDKYSELDVIAMELKKIDTFQKIIVDKNRIILVNQSGIFEFVKFDNNGILKGNISDNVWSINNNIIKNPFLLKGQFIYNYLITSTNIKYEISGVRLVSKQTIKILVESLLNKNVLTQEQIIKNYQLIGDKYGYNQD